MCILMGKSLAVFFYSKVFFLVKNAKIDFFKEKKNGFESCFLKKMFTWLQTDLTDLKDTKQLKMCL